MDLSEAEAHNHPDYNMHGETELASETVNQRCLIDSKKIEILNARPGKRQDMDSHGPLRLYTSRSPRFTADGTKSILPKLSEITAKLFILDKMEILSLLN